MRTTTAMQISVIIPTLNEENSLSATLQAVSRLSPAPCEVIVVDGGSTDNTLQVARTFRVRICQTARPGRALQMNYGARLATGSCLCFLHADTLVPADMVTAIRHTLSQRHIVLAGFTSVMKGKQTRYLTSFLNFTKTYFIPCLYRPHRFVLKGFRLLFGDQVIFCRKNDFWKVGGFDEQLTIMEEADLCLRINRLGSIKQLRKQVISSDRRMAAWGTFRTFYVWISICILWALGISDQKLKKIYHDIR